MGYSSQKVHSFEENENGTNSDLKGRFEQNVTENATVSALMVLSFEEKGTNGALKVQYFEENERDFALKVHTFEKNKTDGAP